MNSFVFKGIFTVAITDKLLAPLKEALEKGYANEGIIDEIIRGFFKESSRKFLEVFEDSVPEGERPGLELRILYFFYSALEINKIFRENNYPKAGSVLILKYENKRQLVFKAFPSASAVNHEIGFPDQVAVPVISVECSKDFNIFGLDDAFSEANSVKSNLCRTFSEAKDLIENSWTEHA